MAKVPDWYSRSLRRDTIRDEQFAVPEGSTLAGAARTDDPPVVPMSGGQGPAGAAKDPVLELLRQAWVMDEARVRRWVRETIGAGEP